MYKNRIAAVVIALIMNISVLLLCSNVSAEFVPGELLVKYRKSTSPSLVNSIHADAGSTLTAEFTNIRVQRVKISGGLTVEEAIEMYNEKPEVEYAEPNYIINIHAIPNDTEFDELWGLHNNGHTGGMYDADIDVPEAWDITVGSRNVIIAVVDTGVAYYHPDLHANMWMNPGESVCDDGLDNDNNGYVDDCFGWDFVGNDNSPMDYNGHGTHVAGIIAGQGNNNEGTSGVMWEARIMPVRIVGINGTGTTADAVSAIQYADDNGAQVINLSWGSSNYSRALKDAIEASDALVVCAAGNSSNNNDITPDYPASYTSSNIISVAASDSNDNLAFFSNYGRTSVDLAAPGLNIYSSHPVFDYGYPVVVYDEENFDGADLDDIGWARDSGQSTWDVTDHSGMDGSGSLEDSPGSRYPDSTISWAGYMTPIESVKDNIYTLHFTWKGELERNADYMDINYSLDGITWEWIDYRTGLQEEFISDLTLSFTGIAELHDRFYFGFGITSDNSVNGDGVYLENISMTRKSITVSDFDYSKASGTSMAAPFVSGVAGLILAAEPELTHIEVKNKIIQSVDKVPTLSNKVLSGGRLNAFNALQAEPDVNPCTGDPALCVTVSNSISTESGGGGCFIATAAYGSLMHPYVKKLRQFRDQYLLTHDPGKKLVHLYYTYSPPLAEYIRDRELLRFITRVVLAPLVMTVSFPGISLGIILTALCMIFLRPALKKSRHVN